jgi:serralysin
MTNILDSLNAEQKNLVGYLNGLTTNGTLGSDNYATVFGGSAAKWAGGVIKYWLDPGSNWSVDEINSIRQAMTIWSGVTNVTFVATDDPSGAVLTVVDKSRVLGGNKTQTVNGWEITEDDGTSVDSRYDIGKPGDAAIPTYTRALMILDTQGMTALGTIDEAGDTAALGDQNYGLKGGDGPYAIVHELGHVLGLGHAGPYNGNVNPLTDQFNAYDMSQWAIMSYIYPDNATKYKAQYPDSAQNSGWMYYDEEERKTRTARATTPMVLDIAAGQQVYGTATSPIFSGGQVFGFNSNIYYTDLSGNRAKIGAYDFAIDKLPVVTIWDSGTNNTLDVSGFGNDSYINLHAGSFSSVAGLTNNIGIANNTRIDRVIGGTGSDTFVVNGNNNYIRGGGGTDIAVFSGERSQYTIQSSTANSYIVAGPDGTDVLRDVQRASFGDGSTVELAQSATGRFDALRYEASFPDLIRAFGANADAAAEHFLESGAMEGRSAALFNPSAYLAAYGDLQAAFGNDLTAATTHYLTYGFWEGRTAGALAAV